MTHTAYLNARLLDPATGLDVRGDVLVEGETIAAIGPGVGAVEGAEIVDCAGLCLAPGLVDMRVQLREPGDAHKETIATGGAAAVAGGVTAMVCVPEPALPIDDTSTIEFIARRARQVGLAKVFAYAAATRGLEGREMSEIGLLAEAGALGFTDGTKVVANALVMRRCLSYAANFSKMIIQHAEEPTLSANGAMNEGEMATRLGLPGIPAAAEAIMLERDMRLVEITGGRYHAAHIATAAGVEVIRQAKHRGLAVTCDTAPPYFALNELAVGDWRSFAKLSPPLRTEDDRRAVVAGLADGTIDAIASDHAPQDQDSKRLPFTSAAAGGIGLETLLPITLELVHNKHLTLLRALELVTSAPARLLGLKLGALAVGGPADLVLFDLDRAWKIKPAQFRSKSKNSPFDGRPAQGRAVRTVVDGRTVYQLDA